MNNEHPTFERMEDLWVYVGKQAQKRVRKTIPEKKNHGIAPNPTFGAGG